MAVTAATPGTPAGRQAIIEAVVRVAARSGFDGLTYRAVAQEAGVTHGLVRHHFGSLDAAVHEAVEWVVDEAIERSPLRTTDSIDDFATQLSEVIGRDRDQAVFQHGLVFWAQTRPELLAEVRRFQRRYTDAIARSLAAIGFGEPELLARTVFAMLNGFVLHQLTYGDPKETDEHVAVLHDLLRRRLRSERASRRR
jgi:AcrR family transcriptional regulator